MREKIHKITDKTVKVISSKYFLWVVIVIFVLQAMWIAFSFRYPMLYDEVFHVDAIKLFSKQISPFILNQPTSYDVYGNLANGDATLFHYLMSFPYRLVAFFTSSNEFLVITMRIIDILFVAIGLYLFYRLFKKLNVNKGLINVSILMFTLLPIVPFVAATTNYDNLLFMLTPLYLIACVNIIQSSKVYWLQYLMLVIIGCFASLVKFTFLPVFAISVIFLAVLIYNRYKKGFLLRFWNSFRGTPRVVVVIYVTISVVLVGLFSNAYLVDIAKYGTPLPSCQQTMAMERCAVSGITQRAVKALATKDERPLQAPSEYVKNWFNGMVVLVTMSGARTTQGATVFSWSLPVVQSMIFFGIFISAGVLLYAWRSLMKNQSWNFLFFMSIALIIAVFFYNYSSYIKYHQSFAVQPRYLLSFMPVLFLMFTAAVNFILREYRFLKLVLLMVVLALFTQGGGVITHILESEDSWYWQNSKVIEANHFAKKILQPLVKVK